MFQFLKKGNKDFTAFSEIGGSYFFFIFQKGRGNTVFLSQVLGVSRYFLLLGRGAAFFLEIFGSLLFGKYIGHNNQVLSEFQFLFSQSGLTSFAFNF